MSIPMQRYPIFDVATPLKDLIFYEIVDYNLQSNRDMEYGTPHHNVQVYPHHILVYIAPNDKEAKTYRFYYAAKRENQDLYNFSSGYDSIGGLMLPTVTRTYISLREEYNAFTPSPNAPMPNVPEGKFAEGFILYRTTQVDAPQEIRSVFVFEEHTYILPRTASGKEYGEIVTSETTTSSIVSTGTQPDTGLPILQSTVTPLGNGQSVKVTKTVDGGAWPNPVEHVKGKSRENLVPQKFRNFVTDETKSQKLPSMPEEIALSGDEVSKVVTKETPDRYDQKTKTETIDEAIGDLIGQEYGEIVTLDTFEQLVPEGTPSDTGLNITSSIVTPLGNGKAIKNTKAVTGITWPNPVEHIKGKTRDNLIPQKFRNFVTTETKTTKFGTMPTTITLATDEVSKIAKKETPDRVEVRTTTEVLDEATQPLLGSQLFFQFGGGIATSSESLVNDGVGADSGFLVLSSSVSPLGNGKSIKETVTSNDEYAELRGQKYDSTYNIDIPFKRQVIPANSTVTGADVSPLDKWKSQKEVVDIEELQIQFLGIHTVMPTRQTVQLPNVLEEAKVSAIRTLSNGDGMQIGESSGGSTDSSLAVSADLFWTIKEGYTGPAPAEVHVFFLKSEDATIANILAKTGASEWPLFQPKSHRVVLTGHGITKGFNWSNSSGGASASESASVRPFSNVAVIPACIHEEISITVSYHDYTAPNTLIDQYRDNVVDAYTARLNEKKNEVNSGFYNGYPIDPARQDFLTARLNNLETQLSFLSDLEPNDFQVMVDGQESKLLSATTPSSITGGKYVYDTNIKVYGYGLVQVTAVVVDITSIV